MSYKNDKARLIYIDNSGNYKLMKENKCLKEYKKFRIPKDKEIVWRDEYIKEQFAKAENQCITGMQLVESVYYIILYSKDYSYYKMFLSIKRNYLANSDLFEQDRYFEKAISVMSTILEANTDIADNKKIEIVSELEEMIIETINKKDDLPNKIYEGMTKKYGLDYKANRIESNLDNKNYVLKGIKEMILNGDDN